MVLLNLFIVLAVLIIKTDQKVSFYNDYVLVDTMAFKKTINTEEEAMNYLDHFGHMSHQERTGLQPNRMKEILQNFQRFMGIEETGVLDTKTMDMMNMPRCGVPDNVNANWKKSYSGSKLRLNNLNQPRLRFKRYNLQGSAWETRNLTWKITRYSSSNQLRGQEEEIDSVIRQSFQEWARNSNLRFTEEVGSRRANIEVQFVRRDHSDGHSFDGPGRTLAHAFFPSTGGDIHFDDDENWTIEGGSGVDLLSVAVHELGHSLGLGHSDQREALMFPTYSGEKKTLRDDDIRGIEELYGKRQRKSAGSSRNKSKRPGFFRFSEKKPFSGGDKPNRNSIFDRFSKLFN